VTRETSIAVYRDLEASGALSRLRLLVAADIAEHGPTTQAETSIRLQAIRGGRANYKDSYQQRFAELQAMMVIEAVGERTCSVTKKNCIEWDLTGRMPIEREKKMTRVESERAACYQIANDVAEDTSRPEEHRRVALEIARRIIERVA